MFSLYQINGGRRIAYAPVPPENAKEERIFLKVLPWIPSKAAKGRSRIVALFKIRLK